MFEYQGQFYEYDLQIKGAGERRVRVMSEFWRKRGYKLGDRIGFPTGTRAEHVQRAEERVGRARTGLAKTRIHAAGNARGMAQRGWTKDVEGGTPILRHKKGIVYAWEGDLYGQRNGGRVRKFSDVHSALAHVETEPAPVKRAATAAPRKATVKKAAQVARKPPATRTPSWVKTSTQTADKWTHGTHGVIVRKHSDVGVHDRPYQTADRRRHRTLAEAKMHLQDRTAARMAAAATPRKRTARATPAPQMPAGASSATSVHEPTVDAAEAVAKLPAPSKRARADVKAAAKAARDAGSPMTRADQESLYRERLAHHGGKAATIRPGKTGRVQKNGTIVPGLEDIGHGGAEPPTRAGHGSAVMRRDENGEPITDNLPAQRAADIARTTAAAAAQRVTRTDSSRRTPAEARVLEPDHMVDPEMMRQRHMDLPPMQPQMTFGQWSRTWVPHRPELQRMSEAQLQRTYQREMGLPQTAGSRIPREEVPAPHSTAPLSDTDRMIHKNAAAIARHQANIDSLTRSRVYGPELQSEYQAARAKMQTNMTAARLSHSDQHWADPEFWADQMRTLDNQMAQFNLHPLNRRNAEHYRGIPPKVRRRDRKGKKSYEDAIGADYVRSVAAGIRFQSEIEYQFKLIGEGKLEYKDADDQHTGVMVALILSDQDANTLALPGGEQANQLHCTLIMLGDASRYDQYSRENIVKAVRNASLGMTTVKANIFGASVFNPTSPQPAIVLGVGGKDLTSAKTLIEDVCREDAMAMQPADSYAPWVPHITLAYAMQPGDDMDLLMGALERADGRTVTFDRIRVAFGENDVVDIELNGWTPPTLSTRLRMMKNGASPRGERNQGVQDTGRLNNSRVGENQSFGGYFARSQ